MTCFGRELCRSVSSCSSGAKGRMSSMPRASSSVCTAFVGTGCSHCLLSATIAAASRSAKRSFASVRCRKKRTLSRSCIPTKDRTSSSCGLSLDSSLSLCSALDCKSWHTRVSSSMTSLLRPSYSKQTKKRFGDKLSEMKGLTMRVAPKDLTRDKLTHLLENEKQKQSKISNETTPQHTVSVRETNTCSRCVR